MKDELKNAKDKTVSEFEFDRWLKSQGVQGVKVRECLDEQILRDIFDAMDDEDKQ